MKNNDNKTIYIHVGPHKTGTTYIQNILKTNQKILRDNGVLIPRAGMGIKDPAHHNIAWQFGDSKHYRPGLGGASEIISQSCGFNKIIITSENFSFSKIEFFRGFG